MSRFVPSLFLLLCVPLLAAAQPTDSAVPIFHGILDVRPARGSIDPESGSAALKVHRWRFLPTPDSDGLFPDQEPVEIAIGEKSYRLEAGALRAKRRGKVFVYRAPRGDTLQPVRSLRIQKRRDGSYAVRFSLRGVDLSALVFRNLQCTPQACMPTAVIVGDDDGFSGVNYVRPNCDSPRLNIPSACKIDTWPWA